MMDKITLNELKVLSTLLLKERYGLEIIKAIHDETGNVFRLGTLYNLLSRLEKKGLVNSRWGEDTDERGGNRRRYYKITGLGERCLREEQNALSALWKLSGVGNG